MREPDFVGDALRPVPSVNPQYHHQVGYPQKFRILAPPARPAICIRILIDILKDFGRFMGHGDGAETVVAFMDEYCHGRDRGIIANLSDGGIGMAVRAGEEDHGSVVLVVKVRAVIFWQTCLCVLHDLAGPLRHEPIQQRHS